MSNERDYIDRTIAMVRNHRGANNCWPQWANIFADEIERLRALVDQSRDEVHRRDVVLDWLRENTPRSLELCPYKLGASVGGSAAPATPERQT